MFHHQNQFPYPTRPSNAPSQDSNVHHQQEVTLLTPQLQDTKLYNNPVLPDHAAISSSSSSSSNANYSIMGDPSPSLDDDDETPKGEKEVVDELLSILVDCLKNELSTPSRAFLLRKFFAEVEKVETLQNLIQERCKQSKFEILTELYERLPSPIDQDVSVMTLKSIKNVTESAEKFTEKLERFKVRNLAFEEDEENKLERFRVRTLDFDEDEEEKLN